MKKNIIFMIFISILLVFSACSSQENVSNETIEIENEIEINEIERKDIDETETQTSLNEIAETLSGNGKYTSPAGEHTITLKLNLDSNGDVVSFDSTIDTDNEISNKKFNAYKSGLNETIIGKKIDEIEFPKIMSGSSLSSEGFTNALENIKSN